MGQVKDMFTNRWRRARRGGRLQPDRKTREAAMQRALVARVRRCRAPGLLFFHVPNGLWLTDAVGAWMVEMGVKAGMVDLVFALPGRVLCLELKAEDGELRDAQLEARKEIVGVMWGWAVRDTLESATELLVECGFIRPGKW